MTSEQDIWRQAVLLTEIGVIPLTGELEPADALDELEKHQLWLEQSNSARPDQAPCAGTMTPAGLALLSTMRREHPSTDDALWEGTIPQH